MINKMDFTLVEYRPGSYVRGSGEGKYNERPAHTVHLPEGFFLSEKPVTFAQYEQFRPGFREELRRVKRWSQEKLTEYYEYAESMLRDNDPAVGVTWHDAIAFCNWLGGRDGRHYRLPTEAEWEYAALLAQGANKSDAAVFASLEEGCACGIEEWCFDWYGPYNGAEQTNPGGYPRGTTKVTRGASSWQPAASRRLTNRMSFLPEARQPKLGFRIAVGAAPVLYKHDQPAALHSQHVRQEAADWKKAAEEVPLFIPPIAFVHIPPHSNGPVFSNHNHFPSITWCPNGDLLATWFTDPGVGASGEEGSQLNIAASRLRRGAAQWETASLFWAAADRNNHSAALWTDPATGRLYHFQGTGSHPNQGNQILFLRTSDDSGATWSAPRIISDMRSMWNPHVCMKTRGGTLVVTSDFNFDQPMWGRIILSRDGGQNWHAPQGRILGQHPGIVELKDGRWLAVGRDNWNAQHDALPGTGLPLSTSADEGATWTYRREPALGSGINWRQRPVLIRLAEGPILYIGFTDKWSTPENSYVNGIDIVDQAGVRRKVYGMFCALSYDEGESWTGHKLLTPGAEPAEYDGGGNTGKFFTDAAHAEPAGYIQAMQSPDGIIHLISSKLHYRFNYAWLKSPTVAG